MAKDVRVTRGQSARAPEGGSLLGGALVALVLGVLLFWLPVFGPFAAGLLGGRVAGTPGRGVLAAVLPALVVAGLAAVIALALPVIGPFLAALVGGAVLLWGVAQLFFTIVGAAAGGWWAQAQERRPRGVAAGPS